MLIALLCEETEYLALHELEVLIPMYNSEKTIRRAIKSVPQSVSILVLDDGSEDSSVDEIIWLQKEEDNIELIRNVQNQGTLFSRCRLIDSAAKEYLIFLDSDDELNSTAIGLLERSTEWDILFTNQYDDEGVIKITSANSNFNSAYSNVSLLNKLLFENVHFFTFANKVIRRPNFLTVCQKYSYIDIKVVVSEDFLLLFDAIVTESILVQGSNVNLYKVNVNYNSITKSNPETSYAKCLGDYLVKKIVLGLARQYHIEVYMKKLLWWLQLPHYALTCQELSALILPFQEQDFLENYPRNYNELSEALYENIPLCYGGDAGFTGNARHQATKIPQRGNSTLYIYYEWRIDEFDEVERVLAVLGGCRHIGYALFRQLFGNKNNTLLLHYAHELQEIRPLSHVGAAARDRNDDFEYIFFPARPIARYQLLMDLASRFDEFIMLGAFTSERIYDEFFLESLDRTVTPL